MKEAPEDSEEGGGNLWNLIPFLRGLFSSPPKALEARCFMAMDAATSHHPTATTNRWWVAPWQSISAFHEVPPLFGFASHSFVFTLIFFFSFASPFIYWNNLSLVKIFAYLFVVFLRGVQSYVLFGNTWNGEIEIHVFRKETTNSSRKE